MKSPEFMPYRLVLGLFVTVLVAFMPRLSLGGSDGDFWLDDAEGRKYDDPKSHPEFRFMINDDRDSISTTNLVLRFPKGLAADWIVVSEDMRMISGTTNQFVQELPYTLRTDNEGLRTVFVKLLKTNGAVSPLFGRSFQLFHHAPSVAFTEPSASTATGRRRWYLKGTYSPSADHFDSLQIQVNGDFVNDHSRGTWWSGYHDLKPGPNQFTVTACNPAGMCATSTVVINYDPTLATRRMPALTCDLKDPSIVGATTDEISLGGTVDDDNTMVGVAVSDGLDASVTNYSVTAAQDGTNWWTVVPLDTGTNMVTVTAKTPASPINQRQYRVIRDPTFFLKITSPGAGKYINAPYFTVTGIASLNLRDAVIRINGEVAEKTLTPTNIIFRSSKPIPTNVDINSIVVTADRPGELSVLSAGSPGKDRTAIPPKQKPVEPVIIRGGSEQ